MNENILQSRIVKTATTAAEEAGKELLRLFGGNLSIRRKYDYPGSIVTNADERADRIILARIKKSRIKSTVVSEEAGTVDFGSDEVLWAVDPLDGTFNYAKNIPYFAVSVGVMVGGTPTVGVIYNPVLNEMFVARKGHGSYLNGRRIHVSTTQSLEDASLIFEWWNPEPKIPDPLGFQKKLYGLTRSLRSPGSVALNLCAVASGRFDGLITIFEKSPMYELCAGCLLVQEAVGIVTNSTGQSWESLKGSVLAGGELVHARLMSMVNSRKG
ncbi:MAG: inositol monophosphatase family protein [Candidatus Bathyarchaeia archaeon]